MPSLNSLDEFISSFANIANEKDDVIAKNLEYTELPLPDKEAPPMDFSRPAPSGESSDETPQEDSGGDFDFSALLGNMPEDVQPQELDEPPSLDDLFQNINQPSSDTGAGDDGQYQSGGDDAARLPSFDDITSSADGLPAEDFTSEVSPESFSMDGIDLSMPDESEAPLTEPELPDLPDIDSEEFDAAEPPAEDFSITDFGSGDIGADDNVSDDFGGIDLGGENPELGISGDDQVSSQDNFEIPDFNLSETESPADGEDETFDGSEGADEGIGDFDLAAFAGVGESPVYSGAVEDTGAESGIDMGGESLGAFEEPLGAEGFDFDNPLPETDFESPLPETDFDIPLPDTEFSGIDFNSGGESDSLPDFESVGAEGAFEGSEDAGSIDLGGDFESDSIELETDELETDEQRPEIPSGSSFGNDDFHIPGLEEIFDKPKTSISTAPAQKKKGLFRRRKAEDREEFKADDDVEEIRLSQENLESLLRTLGTYPINLKVACEELIAEKVLLPQQLLKLIGLLVNGAGIRETAAFAEELTGKPIVIPRGFEKMTGAAFEAEQASFAYIFIHNFLPVLRLFAVIAALAASIFYLSYKFIYIPVKAESIYKRGYERIPAGEYQRANQLFNEAFATHQKKKWFYLYAESFRDQRRYLLAEEKYDDLLRAYPRDKKGVLDYANLETYYLLNYDKANRLLHTLLLDYAPNDYEGLVSAGDNFLLWGDSDPEKFYDKYEDARSSYARVLDNYGWTPPILERMLRFFIRTDNLKEVLNCRAWFENNDKAKLSPMSIAELGGYLLDKQLEEVKGVPDAYLESIESVRNMLLEAIMEELELPEPHYHLARYHHWLGNTYEERLTLENAIRAFDLAKTETVRRRQYRVDTHFRYANLLVSNSEFFPAEEQIVRGIQLYEDFLSRNLLSASPQLGELYALKGDLEYFVKTGDMNASLNNYRIAERYGYSPPEIQYRMGSAYYQLQDWRNALEYLIKASANLPLNRRLLFALGNASYQRGDYFAAQGYYDRLLGVLDNQRIRMPVLLPNDNPQFLELGERIMMAMNNAGVVYEALADQTTNRNLRSTAIAYYTESARAWDSITRNPESMIRMHLTGSLGSPGINLGYLNASNAMRSGSDYRPEIFVRIDKDVLEPSRWEELAPANTLQ